MELCIPQESPSPVPALGVHRENILQHFWLLPTQVTRSRRRRSNLTTRLTTLRAGVETAPAGTISAEDAGGERKGVQLKEPLASWKCRNTPFVPG